ncbi:PIH1 domain-containing protein 1-like [Ischnura elegans]|uniref:PIH1 domain-containing protein 1-like n=1 Tax=Ischnura elegans TaxID=197161 RepID=UPI001ED8A201|nr:PIH1 domain-containing protein 1-like [Ischnura elegans]
MTTKGRVNLLEPDRSLLDKNLLFSPPDDEIEDLILRRAAETSDLPWTMIKPTPGFCVKLKKNTIDREKVFINICKSDQIPAPEDKTESELMEILQSDEPSAFRVPMSVGEERPDYDKSGKPCSVFDIVVNPEFYKKVESSQLYRRFIITAVFEALEDKYGIELEKDEFTILKGRKCKGGMTDHRIQVRSKPLVEMMPSSMMSNISEKELDAKSGSNGSKKPLITEIETTPIFAPNERTDTEKQKPPYIIRRKYSNEGDCIMVAEILLKDVLLAKDIELDVGEDRILLQTKSNRYHLDLFHPYIIDQEKTTAKFSTENKVLLVEMPLER